MVEIHISNLSTLLRSGMGLEIKVCILPKAVKYVRQPYYDSLLAALDTLSCAVLCMVV
jgi:hypothetical protein